MSEGVGQVKILFFATLDDVGVDVECAHTSRFVFGNYNIALAECFVEIVETAERNANALA